MLTANGLITTGTVRPHPIGTIYHEIDYHESNWQPHIRQPDGVNTIVSGWVIPLQGEPCWSTSMVSTLRLSGRILCTPEVLATVCQY